MAHGRDDDANLSMRIATLAGDVALNLDAERSNLYFDLVINSVSEVARCALKAMDIRKYEYQSDFARQYVAQGEQRGRAAILAKQLARKFGLGVADSQQRVARYCAEEQEAIAYRMLTSNSLEEVLGG